ncbi:MAG: nitrogen regulation protein NR(II) [Sandaracinaceae bacterium]
MTDPEVAGDAALSTSDGDGEAADAEPADDAAADAKRVDAEAVDAEAAPVPTPARRLRANPVLLLGARLAVTTVLLGGALVVLRLREVGAVAEDAVITLIALSFATSLGVGLMIPRMRSPARWAALQLGWDLMVITGLVYTLGGAASGFSFLYGVVILAAALTLGPRGAQIATAASLVAYLTTALGLSSSWLPALPGADPITLPDSELALVLLRTLVGLVMVGLLAGGLAERLRRTGGKLRAAEASAAELSRLNEDILRSLGSGLVIVDTDHRISRINPAGATLLDGAPESFAGRPVDAHLPIGDGLLSRGEGTGTRAHGDAFPVGFSCSPLRDERDRVLGTLVLFQDLTEWQALREQANRAERLAALGRLSAGLAHEIRNPLGSISGSVQMVAEAPALDEEDRRLLTLVLQEVDRLGELVSTMLDVGKPKEPQRRRVDLAALASDVGRVAGARSEVETHVRVSEAPVWVHGDPAQLRQVLWNLVKNAQQFTPTGGRVTVEVAAPGGAPRMSVTDEGPGIDEEELAQVFDLFYSTRHHGVGLGLALVRQIVDAHEGRVWVERPDEGGARFLVEIPAEPEAALEPAALPG